MGDNLSMNRRRFIKYGITGAIILTAGQYGLEPLSRFNQKLKSIFKTYQAHQEEWKLLSIEDSIVLTPIIERFLDSIPESPDGFKPDMGDFLTELDQICYTLPEYIKNDLKSLLKIMHFPLSRKMFFGIPSPWELTPPSDIETALEKWEFSDSKILNLTYASLKNLIFFTWYGGNRSWSTMGYPGPPKLFY
tara:strand:+ start:529 stop:1101 length:573 start_codon:yes stop_codon:yes gene_type:complete